MKRIIFLACIVLLVVKGHGQQLKGEIDAISFPEFDQSLRLQKKGTLSRSARYDEGWDQGYAQGHEDGLDDGENCNKYALSPGVVCVEINGVEINCDYDFLDGHSDGWYAGYEAAYQSVIDQKAATCPINAVFDEFFCDCICIEQYYYFDGDGDGYYDWATQARYQCDPPSDQWKIDSEFDGIDCDDSDPNVHSYDECGRCSATSGITTWYFDGDGDGYHGDSEESCSQPLTGGASFWKIVTNGEDCDDSDNEVNVPKTWYYFGDGDSYWGTSQESCLRPTTGISAKWSSDPMSGFDCNDQDSNIFGEVTWYYDGDGDGYHGQTTTSCSKPTSGLPSKWLTVTEGSDCNDSNNVLFNLNPCGDCSNNQDIKMYLDLDGDGYHSYVFEDECANEAILANEDFFIAANLPPELYQNLQLIDLTIGNTQTQQIYGCDVFYFYHNNMIVDGHCPVTEFGTHRLEKYIALPFSSNNGKQRAIFYDDENGYYFLTKSVVEWIDWDLSGNENNAYYEIGGNLSHTTLGEDCDDTDFTVKAYGDWWPDSDEDNYHNGNLTPIENTCAPPSDQWILLENSAGQDCNDDDPDETVLITWYFDNDLDEYYSTTQQGCENPAKGTGDEAKWRQDIGNGPDCYDDDPEANNENRIWYYDADGDNYYGATTNSCRNPAIDTPEEELWKPDPGEGEDCDDTNPDSQTYNACGVCGGSDEPTPQYIDIDGDRYHSVYKFEDCGLNEFSGSLIRAGLPASLVGDGTQNLVITFPSELTHLAGITMTYDFGTDTYTVPDEIIFKGSQGMDCDDLSSTELSNGEWYPDVDGDGYHDDAVAPVIGCTPPNASTYILFANSSGPDCDDADPAYHTSKLWYYDADGDGYYTDSQVSCQSPGEFWNTMSGIGFDDDDDNPFSPGLVPPSQTETFSIPSVIDIVGEEPYEQLEYNGNLYDPSQITIHYRGVTFTYEDLIFERASPEITLESNSLLIPEGHPLMDAVIKISGEPVQTLAVRSETSYTDTGDEQDLRPCNEWTNKVRALYPGYNSVCGDLTIKEVTSAGNYFNELFDPAQFNVFKSHYDTHGHPPFGIKFQSFVEGLNADLKVESQPVIDETIGPENEIGIIITARKTIGGTIEYVVSIRDETFEPTDVELQREGWKDASGNWTGDLNQAAYSQQLSEMQQFRKLMPGVLALDYSTISAIIPTSPAVSVENGLPDLPAEAYPTYNYGTWGFLTKLVEFYEIGHHVSHEFKVPNGIWDPASEDWDRWRAKSPASVSGALDASIRELRDLADMVKLAQSLCYKKTWEQILEAVKNFNAGEQVRAMISSFQDQIETLQGNNGPEKQYYEIGKITVLTVSAIYAGWKLVGKIAKKFSKIDPENPVSKMDQKNLDLQDTFAEKINKSPEFSNLSKELQDKLTDDLAQLKDGDAFSEALAGNPGLIKSWEVARINDLPSTNTQYLNVLDGRINNTDFPFTKSLAEEVFVRGEILDEVIGNTGEVKRVISDLIGHKDFINHEDLLTNLDNCFTNGIPDRRKLNTQLNEFREGQYWISRGEKVKISKELNPGNQFNNEVDGLLLTSEGILECKYPNVPGLNATNNVFANLELIIKKFTTESKLTQALKDIYPKRYGQINIANGSFKDITSEFQFVQSVKNAGIIGNESGISLFTLTELKSLDELHIIIDDKRLIIKPHHWD